MSAFIKRNWFAATGFAYGAAMFVAEQTILDPAFWVGLAAICFVYVGCNEGWGDRK